MRLSILTLLLTNFLFISIYSQNESDGNNKILEKWINTEKGENRAATNDKVQISIVTIKNESKAEFEDWISNVLYSALNSSESRMKQAQLKATRWLEPLEPNPDSTWTYCWIMDPLIPNTIYDIPDFLNKEYGEELAGKHLNKFMSFMAREPQNVFLRQTDY